VVGWPFTDFRIYISCVFNGLSLSWLGMARTSCQHGIRRTFPIRGACASPTCSDMKPKGNLRRVLVKPFVTAAPAAESVSIPPVFGGRSIWPRGEWISRRVWPSAWQQIALVYASLNRWRSRRQTMKDFRTLRPRRNNSRMFLQGSHWGSGYQEVRWYSIWRLGYLVC
jgi:hypothetical protein